MVLGRYSLERRAGVGSRNCVGLDCVRAVERGERAYELHDSAVSYPRNGQSPETLRTLADRGIRKKCRFYIFEASSVAGQRGQPCA
jgi:hypothetical protein